MEIFYGNNYFFKNILIEDVHMGSKYGFVAIR